MRDISEQFYDLVVQKRSAAKTTQTLSPPVLQGSGGGHASFAVAANHIAEDILRVNQAVLRDNQYFLRHMCCGVEVDDQPLQETEQLLSGAAQHVEQLKALIDTAASSTEMNPQQLAHLHTIVAGLYELLQECSSPFSILQSTHRTLLKQAAVFSRGAGIRPKPADSSDPMQISDVRRNSTKQDPVTAVALHEGDEPMVSDQEARQLQQENRALQNQLNDMAADILEVEATAQSLSALASLFASKVEEQNGQIEQIHRNAQESTDFVKQAAKQITQATKHGVSFRFLILAALVGGSVVLLILHAIIP